MANARHAVRDCHAGQRCAKRESTLTNARHAIRNPDSRHIDFAPRRAMYSIIHIIIAHLPCSADRQHVLAVQRPGQVAAVALSAAGAAGHNVRRQRRGRQERRDHQHREHETQKSFSHVFPPCSFFSCHFVSSPTMQEKRCA